MKFFKRLSPAVLRLKLDLLLSKMLGLIVGFFKKGVVFKWVFLAFAAMVSFLLGWWGFETQLETMPSEAIYRSLQLFVLESGANLEKSELPWQIEWSRFLAAGVSAYAILLTLLQLFYDRIRNYQPRLWNDHIIITGLGSTGDQLVQTYRGGDPKTRESVAVIESSELNDNIKTAEENGAVVFCGDAADPHLLKNAGIARARCLIAVCKEDETNLEVALRAMKLSQSNRRLEIFIHLADMNLFHLLINQKIFSKAHDMRAVRVFNYFETTARHLLLNHFLDWDKLESKGRYVHLIIVGFGFMGEALMLQAAKIGHYANGHQEKLRITVIDNDVVLVRKKEARLKRLCIDRVCNVEFIIADIEDKNTQERVIEWTEQEGAIANIALCLKNEHTAFSLALELSKKLHDNVPVFIRITEKKGLTSLVMEHRSKAHCEASPIHFKRIIPFGLPEEISTPEAIMTIQLDRLAEAVYEKYGEEKKDLPAWRDLDECEKISNRVQADHIHIKLRAIGCYAAAAPHSLNDLEIDHFSDAEIELLACMEHSRWNAERFLGGWQLYTGTEPWNQLSEERRHQIKKELHRSPFLVDWCELQKKFEEILEEDYKAIENIFNILSRIGEKVFRKAF